MSKQGKRSDIHWAWLIVLSTWCALGWLDHLGNERRISALEQDVQTLIEFMPMVVEREASGD